VPPYSARYLCSTPAWLSSAAQGRRKRGLCCRDRLGLGRRRLRQRDCRLAYVSVQRVRWTYASPVSNGRGDHMEAQVSMCHGKLTPLWRSYFREDRAREGTEGPCKPSSDRRRVSEAGQEGSRRHACGVRLRAHTRGAAFGGGPQASDFRDERRATRQYACQWPPRADRYPAGTTLRPELAWFWPSKTGETRRLTVVGVCNVQRARKV
jgi:hypothetical protein